MLHGLSRHLGTTPLRVLGSFSQKYSLNLPAIAKKLNEVAIPAVVLLALSNIKVVSAGPLAYAACVSGCELTFTQAGIALAPATAGWSILAILSGPLGCPIICSPTLAAPTP